jgi:hypothetical protein
MKFSVIPREQNKKFYRLFRLVLEDKSTIDVEINIKVTTEFYGCDAERAFPSINLTT